MKRTAIFTLLFITLMAMFGLSSAHAQVGSSVVTATANFTVSTSDVITLKAQIVSCGTGQLPLYNGVPISITPNQTPAAPFTATNTGSAQSVTFTVPGNDQIICGSQNYSLYAITWYDNGFPLAPTQTYRFADNTVQTLSQLVPISFIPPVISNAAGALCPVATPIFMGFSSNYQIQCAAAVSNLSAALPITGGTLLGNLIQGSSYFSQLYSVTSNNITTKFVNGIPLADQFSGADFCAKLRAANVYALANNLSVVDATHFSNTQNCATDPFINLATAGTAVKLTVLLPAAVISSTVNTSGAGITVNNNGLNLIGMGRAATVFQYTGTASLNYVLGAVGTGLGQNSVWRDFSVLGNNHVTDDILMQSWHRSTLQNMSFWGATGCGFHTEGAVTDTFIKLHVSNADATAFGWIGLQQPANGACFDQQGGNQTTDGTVIDLSVESVSNIGWDIISASSMHFSSGTSESNAYGIQIAGSSSKFNTFDSPDIEQNTANTQGVDLNDNGQSNVYSVPIFSSTCSACNSANASGVGQIIIGEAGAATSFSGFIVFGTNSRLNSSGSTNTIAGLKVTPNVVNAAGFQILQTGACNITAGAIGNNCLLTLTFTSSGGVAEPDTSYKTVCQAFGGTAIWGIGNVVSQTTTAIQVELVALSAAGSSTGGAVNCTITHN